MRLKNGFELLKEHISKKSEAKDSTPEPPKIQTIVDCVNSAGEPKKVLIPDMLREGAELRWESLILQIFVIFVRSKEL